MEPGEEREQREKSLERQIRAFHQVRLLAELPARQAGGEGEREAARRVETWMREQGFDEIAPGALVSRPARGAVIALHAGLAAAGCALGGVAGFLLAAAAALSFRREARGAPSLARWLPAPESVQVSARAGSPRARRRIVLCAPLDAPRSGRVFASPFWRRLLAPRGAAHVTAPAGLDAWLWRLLAAAAVATAASALGAEGALAGLATGALALLCALATLAGIEWARAPASPGAGTSATGVAAMLTCAEQLLAQLRDDEELWLLAAGGHEVGAPALREFLAARGGDFERTALCVHFERLGGGLLQRVRAEVGLERLAHPPRLAELARRVAESGAFGAVGTVDWAGVTGVAAAAARDLPVLALVSLGPDGLARNDHLAADVAEDVDPACAVRAADFAAAVLEACRRGESDPLALV